MSKELMFSLVKSFYFISINQNIQFTSEREQGHVIPFLDVMILHNNDGSLSTKVYR